MNTPIKMRNYGRIIQDVIEYAVTLPRGERRDDLTRTLAVAMVNRNLQWNRDQDPTPNRVIRDMQALSDGRLTISEDDLSNALALRNNGAQRINKSNHHPHR